METQSYKEPHFHPDDEIDLFELCSNIYAHKWLIASITIIITALGVLAAFLSPPTYMATSHFLPPLERDVQALSLRGLPPLGRDVQVLNLPDESFSYTSDDVYQRFLRNIESRSLRRSYFKQNNLLAFYSQGRDEPEERRVFEQDFDQKLQLEKPGRNDDQSSYRLSFELSDAEKSAAWTNGFVDYVIGRTRQELLGEVDAYIRNLVNQAAQEIDSKIELVEQRRLDRVVKLREALQIARAIGLESLATGQFSDNIDMEYMRGSRAIQSEINALEAREHDEPFVDGIRDLQERIAYLSSINIEPETIEVVRIDQRAHIPYEVHKPNRKAIVLITSIAGLMLGLFVALIRQSIRNRERG